MGSFLILPNLLALFIKTSRQNAMAYKCRICPMSLNKEKTAKLVRSGRLAMGFTQLELANLTNISLRSIQRIEKGEVIPRTYTLKILGEQLNVDFDFAQDVLVIAEDPIIRTSTAFKVICSIGLALVLLLLSAAFLSQTRKFPETSFETFLFWALVSVIYTVSLLFIWKNRHTL